jgi:hypothetical protein
MRVIVYPTLEVQARPFVSHARGMYCTRGRTTVSVAFERWMLGALPCVFACTNRVLTWIAQPKFDPGEVEEGKKTGKKYI